MIGRVLTFLGVALIVAAGLFSRVIWPLDR